MTIGLSDRWTKDPIFQEIFSEVILKPGNSRGKSLRDWYRSGDAPMIMPYMQTATQRNLDCRHIEFHNLQFGEHELGHILDHGLIRHNTFIETGFQDGTAKGTKFSGSRFVRAQMSPFYATGANFENCVFVKTFLYGATTALSNDKNGGELFLGTPTDLTNCRFFRAIGDKSDFARCDFKGADFSEAYFEDCQFDETDLRNVNFRSTRFINCNFANAWLSGTPENRALVACGENKNIEQIHWKPVNP